jgi:hypothetical protein
VQAELQFVLQDFFQADWQRILNALPQPLLIVGNPPWVSNSTLGVVGGVNHPRKQNTDGLRGIDALTGKSNFDISESIWRTLLEATRGCQVTLAMLSKTRVARRTLQWAWQRGLPIGQASLFGIDASRDFHAAVDACLLVCQSDAESESRQCQVFPHLESPAATQTWGYREGRVVGNLPAYLRWQHLKGQFSGRWRSGVKHDCARVMELRPCSGGWQNGFGETVQLEETHLFPLVKSSQLARGTVQPDRWLLVPQQRVGQDTEIIRDRAPKTWHYLNAYAAQLDGRRSSVYRGQPRFSVFGVGPYAFAPWKLAVSGFHPTLEFRKLGLFENKPIVLDDTCYFVGCDQEEVADELLHALNHSIAREFYSAFIFPHAKRPVTAEILQLLDLEALRQELKLRISHAE